MSRKFFFGIFIATAFTGCYNDSEELLYPGTNNCSSLNVSFIAEVNPIIQTKCATVGCHDATSANKGGPFTNYNLIKDKAFNIKAQVASRSMPQGSSLSASQIQLISCWVNNGALNN